jgi:hypothetical protein
MEFTFSTPVLFAITFGLAPDPLSVIQQIPKAPSMGIKQQEHEGDLTVKNEHSD